MSDKGHHQHHKALTLAFWLNACFAVIEIAGAIYTNSTAILTDAIHDLGDTLAIGLGIIFEKISQKEPSATYTYGYKRFSLLSALILSLILILSAAVMSIQAIEAIFYPQFVNSQGMWWLAILGIAVNGFAFLKIKQSGKAEHAAHNHQSQNSKAIMLHFLEDVLGWVAVLVGSSIMYYTHWYWIDGLLSIGIAAFISFNALKNLIETGRIFLQAAPRNINTQQLTSGMLNIAGVISVKKMHLWSLSENEVICSVTVVIQHEKDWQRVKQEIEKMLKASDVFQSTIQIETTNQFL